MDDSFSILHVVRNCSQARRQEQYSLLHCSQFYWGAKWNLDWSCSFIIILSHLSKECFEVYCKNYNALYWKMLIRTKTMAIIFYYYS